jgi:tripartite-type tricarboxylate transporter receptor subunit TctC
MPPEALKYWEGFFDKVRNTAGWKKFLADNQLLGVSEKSEESKKFLGTYEDMLRVVLKEAGAKVVDKK